MITPQQMDILSIRGYRVVYTARGEEDGARSVEYPSERPDAFLKRFSQEIFTTAEAAWAHAWQDHQAR